MDMLHYENKAVEFIPFGGTVSKTCVQVVSFKSRFKLVVTLLLA